MNNVIQFEQHREPRPEITPSARQHERWAKSLGEIAQQDVNASSEQPGLKECFSKSSIKATNGVDFYLSKPVGPARNVLFCDRGGFEWYSQFMRSETITALAIRERRTIAFTITAPEFDDAPGPFVPLPGFFSTGGCSH